MSLEEVFELYLNASDEVIDLIDSILEDPQSLSESPEKPYQTSQ